MHLPLFSLLLLRSPNFSDVMQMLICLNAKNLTREVCKHMLFIHAQK